MFALEADASKIAFATLLATLVQWDFELVDCQAYTDHLARFGASDWPRFQFMARLEDAVEKETRLGPWHCPFSPLEAVVLLTESS